MNAFLEKMLDGRHLEEREAADVLVGLTDEKVPPALSGALLAALRAKGETPAEIRGFALAMRRLARRPVIPTGTPIVDVVGTGGDGSGSLNLSTGAALLAAACGKRVVKHGNRAISSRCGSADVLDALGTPVGLDEQEAGECLEQTGFTFLFAPYYHPAMKALIPVRRALGVRTVFNMLGPITNPAEPRFQLVGAYSPAAAELLAEALAGLPIEHAFVVHGEPGWDEATPVGPFLLFDVRPGRVTRETREPADYGLPRCGTAQLAGGDATENSTRMREVFDGERSAHRDAVVLGTALVLELMGTVRAPREAAATAAAALDDGRAARLLGALRSFEAARREQSGGNGSDASTGGARA